MEKIKIIKKEELDFDHTKIKEIIRVDILENMIKISFELED